MILATPKTILNKNKSSSETSSTNPPLDLNPYLHHTLQLSAIPKETYIRPPNPSVLNKEWKDFF